MGPYGLASIVLFVTAVCASGALSQAEPVRRGDIVLVDNFDDAAEAANWSSAPFASLVPEHEGSLCLRVAVPATEAPGGHMVSRKLDVSPWRHCTLGFEALARAEDVTKPRDPWNGVKFMLHYRTPDGTPHWSNCSDLYGSFDWRRIHFASRIPEGVTEAELVIGLQDSTGTVWFDDIRVYVAHAPLTRPEPPEDAPPPYRGHSLPRLRGVMSPNEFLDEDLRVLGEEWNANVIRWQMTWVEATFGGRNDLAEDFATYDAWLAAEIADLELVLDACERYGIMVVVDLHTPPGGTRLFEERRFQDKLTEVWTRLAELCRGRRAVWGYDLVNEPISSVPTGEGCLDWMGLAERVARAIREVDADATVIVEAELWASAAGFELLEPIPLEGVVYSVHMYEPGAFTHQGVFGPTTGVMYPGEIGGVQWDKEQLRRWLQPVVDFQRAYNVHIYVGEFSAIRWAPGDSAYQYIRDCIELFEEYGWDWCYHAYREWDGWSVEHGPDRDDHTPTVEPTDRMKLLLGWFALNEKPW